MADQSTSVSHNLVKSTNPLNIVTRIPKGLDDGRVKSVFNTEVRRLCSPGPSKQPPRGRNRLLQALAVHDVTREHHGLGLRLSLATHGPIRHDATICQARHRWLDRMKGSTVRLQAIVVRRIKGETGATVLPHDARDFEYRTRTVLPINALNQTD